MANKFRILSSKKGYDLAAREYDKKERYLNSFEGGNIMPLLGHVIGKNILDVGAGTGRLAVELLKCGAKVVALDVSKKMLEVLKKKNGKVTTVMADAENLPFEDEMFDFVVAAFLIVHLKDSTKFFDEAYRVLKNGGKLVVTNINQKEPPEINTEEGKIKIESYYHRPEEVRRTLEDLAFAIEAEIFVKEGDVWVNQILVGVK